MDDGVVVHRRSVVIALTTLPVLAVSVLLDLALQIDRRPVVLALAAGTAAFLWLAWRLLTAEVRVGDRVVTVRGVGEDVEMTADMVTDVTVDDAPRWLRLLLWGVLTPRVVRLHLADGSTLAPVALWAGEDDPDVGGAVLALQSCTRRAALNALRQARSA